jgi:hypothetical protein
MRMKNNKFPVIFLSLFVTLLFWDFFAKGYVLDANHDVREVLMPYHFMESKALHSWNVPQWNPYVRCGTSFLGNGHNLFYYPPLFLIYHLPEEMLPFLITLILILHVLTAGFFAYLFFKKITGDEFWALTASVVYLFSSSSIINMTVGISCFSFLTYLPIWLYLIRTQRERSFLLNLTLTTFALTMFFLVGSFQRVIYTFWFCFLYMLFESFSRTDWKIRFDVRPMIINVMSSTFAFMIAFVRLGPFFWNSRHGITSPTTFKQALTYVTIRPMAALRLFVPEFFGTKLHYNFFNWGINNINHLEMFNCYVGIAGIVILLYVFLFVWDRRAIFWKMCISGILLVIFSPPFTFVHYVLTRRSALNYGRLVWFLPICAAALIGIFGASYFSDRVQIKKMRSTVFPAFLAVTGILFLCFNLLKNTQTLNETQIKTMFYSIVYFSVMGSVFIAGLFALRKTALKYFLLMFITADLFIIAKIDSNNSNAFLSPYSAISSFADDEKKLPELFDKQNRSFRVLTAGRPNLLENRCAELGFYSSCGHDSFSPAHIVRIYRGSYELNEHRNMYVKNPPSNSTALGLSSTLFFMMPNQIFVAKNRDFIPRTSLYTEYVVLADEKQAFERVMAASHDLQNVLVLDREPCISIADSDKKGKTVIIKEDNEHINISAMSPGNSILFITDTYHEGWKAYVDGSETEIMRANYAFKAVCVPAGTHRLEFRFKHPALKTSWVISGFGLLFFLITSVFCRRR